VISSMPVRELGQILEPRMSPAARKAAESLAIAIS